MEYVGIKERNVDMIKIRRGVFETNSSSSHVIVLTNESCETSYTSYATCGYLRKDKKTGETVLFIEGHDFDRNFEVFTSWIDRLSYSLASFKYNDIMIEQILDIVKKRRPDIDRFKFAKNYEGETDYGTVDHQSQTLLRDMIYDAGVKLEDFIFNDHFILFCDGDEYQVFNTLGKTGIIDTKNLEKVFTPDDFYKYDMEDEE